MNPRTISHYVLGERRSVTLVAVYTVIDCQKPIARRLNLPRTGVNRSGIGE
jgi:hypothetical protein